MEEARAMLHDQDLALHLWEEASRATVYVQNHTPNRVLDKKTLEEAFFKRETRSQPSENIWLPGVHTYPKGEKDQARSFWEEGNIRRIQ